jgi:hypothetical protein
MDTQPAYIRLQSWLDGQERSQSWLARKCCVEPSSAHRWLRGETKPQRLMAAQIEIITGGAIKASEWGA